MGKIRKQRKPNTRKVTEKSLQNLKKWKKGQSGNPLGSKLHRDPTQRLGSKIKRLSAKEVWQVGTSIMRGDIEALEDIASDPRNSVLQVWVANAARIALFKGDAYTLELLLNRFVGKIADKTILSGKVEGMGSATQVILTIPANGRESPDVEMPTMLESEVGEEK